MTTTDERLGKLFAAPSPAPTGRDVASDNRDDDGAKVDHPDESPLTRIWAKLNTPLNRRQRSESASADPSDPNPDTIDTTEFLERAKGPASQIWITRTVFAVVAVCLISGPLALVLGGGSNTSIPPKPVIAPAQMNTQASGAAADLASELVSTWLTAHRGSEEILSHYVDVGSDVTLPDTTLYSVSDIRSVVSPPQTGSTVYSVKVSASVSPLASSGAAVRRYYLVPVAVIGGNVRALSLPSPAPSPSTNVKVGLDYDNDAATSAPIVQAASGFLTAMLTGSGDVTRFTSPGAHLAAITPAPFTKIDLALARADQPVIPDASAVPVDGQRIRLLITVTAHPAGASTDVTDGLPMTYALTMTARAGRWEVTSVDPAPAANITTGDASNADTADPAAADPTTATTSTQDPIATTGESAAPSATPAEPETTEPPADTPPLLPSTKAPSPTPETTVPKAPNLTQPGGTDLGPAN
ncbi:hypothetical protein GOEFS_119_00200 [Gordonia effusa NBRC 100432]|uniref:Conjugative transposon protein TcpC n=1 Tax=Gordonia effusa NBRC 100432 TaxID=1077974 RepID=H0R629_9ACTN|nr:conjugal transfer protein [Gordonia effusa]GAB20530.1 hypothetical protein GOEFS_119_00200 [Gordonia effusa NBRC 100432]